MTSLPYLWIGLGALVTLVTAYLGVAYLRVWAARSGVVDIPNARSSHTQPTARGGGLAITGCTLLGFWLLLSVVKSDLAPLAVAAYTGSALLIALISWYDDLYSVPNRLRFGIHTLAALLILFGVGMWDVVTLPVFGEVALGWLGFAITLLWIIGLTNAYNFMDGIDGLAGGQAVIAGLAWCIMGWWTNNLVIGLLGSLIAASSGGFLLHNWPPARIFMGDVGSAFLGFTFAVLALMGSIADPRLAVVGVVLLWPFVFDTAFTLLRRLRHGENIFEAHRSHLYQRLVIAGQPHRGVTLFYLLLALGGSGLAAMWLLYPAVGGWLLLLWFPISVGALWVYVRKIEAATGQRVHLATAAPTPTPSSDLG